LEVDFRGVMPLKRWLRRAKIDRPELFADDATRQALRFHDLRATGITWRAVRGDPGEQIKRRAGHTDATTERYIREAEVLREGFGEVFPALPELSGDWAKVWAKPRKMDRKYMKSMRGGRDSNAFPVSFSSVRRRSVFRLIVRVPSPFCPLAVSTAVR
jgi:hypothetical protein